MREIQYSIPTTIILEIAIQRINLFRQFPAKSLLTLLTIYFYRSPEVIASRIAN
jgi:hypothetical protein